jgi:hypothetical protein
MRFTFSSIVWIWSNVVESLDDLDVFFRRLEHVENSERDTHDAHKEGDLVV